MNLKSSPTTIGATPISSPKVKLHTSYHKTPHLLSILSQQHKHLGSLHPTSRPSPIIAWSHLIGTSERCAYCWSPCRWRGFKLNHSPWISLAVMQPQVGQTSPIEGLSFASFSVGAFDQTVEVQENGAAEEEPWTRFLLSPSYPYRKTFCIDTTTSVHFLTKTLSSSSSTLISLHHHALQQQKL